eukprot:13281153-Alexandrium_andersonii.AAC.1
MPTAALARSTAAAPATARGKLATVRATIPRQFLSPDQWRKAVSAPVTMLAQVMGRAAYHGDMGWKT